MRKVRECLTSGLIGTGIGSIWYLIEAAMNVGNESLWSGQVAFINLAFWIISAFFIGVIFYSASYIFSIEKWSFKKQVFVNFFILLIGWTLFNEIIDDFKFDGMNLLGIVAKFIVMYLIGYGSYFLNLRKQIKEINQKLASK